MRRAIGSAVVGLLRVTVLSSPPRISLPARPEDTRGSPPKKVLVFHLDDVGYIALVSVTVSGGKLEEFAAKVATAK